MPRIHCKDCGWLIYNAPIPFIGLSEKCPVCGCIVFCVFSEVDLERERLEALEASGRLISELLGD